MVFVFITEDTNHQGDTYSHVYIQYIHMCTMYPKRNSDFVLHISKDISCRWEIVFKVTFYRQIQLCALIK